MSQHPFDHEPPISADDTNPSKAFRPPNLLSEPPVSADDTNPSRAVRPANLLSEPPVSADDTNPSRAVRPANLLTEPPVVPHHDTRPSMTVPAVIPLWRRGLGALMLLGAVSLTAATLWLMLNPAPSAPLPTATESVVTQLTLPTDTPTTVPTIAALIVEAVNSAQTVEQLPTLQPEALAQILLQPLAQPVSNNGISVVRNIYAPFTVIPDRPRAEVIPYIVEQGDTIEGIASKFGLRPESIAWANDRSITLLLAAGREINIPPVDGVYISQHTGGTTIGEYAARYGISDPYAIIDSEYNPALRGLTPESVPPSGTPIMIAGGVAEQISWNPVVINEGGGGGTSSGGGSGPSFITFSPGDPGSCGRVENPGSSGAWGNPLSNYTWMRGFSGYHTGVDLAAPVGTSVGAASSGRVIFSGWNSWGYGYTVVLAHGPFTTLYGHLSSIYVGCGQDVSSGQSIAGTGNSGNSSGPHLHFEIRFNDQPQDPTSWVGF